MPAIAIGTGCHSAALRGYPSSLTRPSTCPALASAQGIGVLLLKLLSRCQVRSHSDGLSIRHAESRNRFAIAKALMFGRRQQFGWECRCLRVGERDVQFEREAPAVRPHIDSQVLGRGKLLTEQRAFRRQGACRVGTDRDGQPVTGGLLRADRALTSLVTGPWASRR